jgi:flagellar protein FliL
MAAAAEAAAGAADEVPQKKGPSIVVQLGALIFLTAAAAGMGWVSGGMLTSGGSGSDGHAPAAGHGEKANAQGEAKDGHGEAPVSDTVIPLEAITTNIGAPTDVWVRMEASIVLDAPQAPELAGIIQQDLLAYLRTVKLYQVEGASGFRHLKADLEERASIRSDGHVKGLLIRTLLFE